MKFKKSICLFISALLFTFTFGCDDYETFSGTIKVTLVADDSESVIDVVENTTSDIVEEKISIETINESDDTNETENNDMTLDSSTERKIYYTKTGKSYHYNENCGRGTYYECTLEEALAMGLEPCKKCVK